MFPIEAESPRWNSEMLLIFYSSFPPQDHEIGCCPYIKPVVLFSLWKSSVVPKGFCFCWWLGLKHSMFYLENSVGVLPDHFDQTADFRSVPWWFPPFLRTPSPLFPPVLCSDWKATWQSSLNKANKMKKKKFKTPRNSDTSLSLIICVLFERAFYKRGSTVLIWVNPMD